MTKERIAELHNEADRFDMQWPAAGKALRECLHEIEQASATMKWTNRNPDRPGWWWYRPVYEAHEYRPERIVRDGGRGLVCYRTWSDNFKQWPGQWSDQPIPDPET
jgi:hypothetical protein